MDPNLEGVSSQDLKEQFELANRIIAKETEANEAVIEIREIKQSLASDVSAGDYLKKLPEIEA